VQIRLIQEHLTAEAERFSRGDFDDPMKIHGHEMPGVQEAATGVCESAGGVFRPQRRSPATVPHRGGGDGGRAAPLVCGPRMDHGPES
jgi:hypothetical protein